MSKLSDFSPQRRNSNRHTQRGMGMLEQSMRTYGYVAPMTAAADGEIIDGSARIETSANVFGDDVIVVEHDGTKPVIMVRTDIASADSPEARAIAYAANRVAQVDLDFDTEVILSDLQQGVDLSSLWFDWELSQLTGTGEGNDPNAEWQGMPEFQQEDLTGIRWMVHFENESDKNAFEKLRGQRIPDNTKSVWYPQKKWADMASLRYVDES